MDRETIAILQSADELSLLDKVAGRLTAEAKLDQLIAIVRGRLSALPNRAWYGRWVHTRLD